MHPVDIIFTHLQCAASCPAIYTSSFHTPFLSRLYSSDDLFFSNFALIYFYPSNVIGLLLIIQDGCDLLSRVIVDSYFEFYFLDWLDQRPSNKQHYLVIHRFCRVKHLSS